VTPAIRAARVVLLVVSGLLATAQAFASPSRTAPAAEVATSRRGVAVVGGTAARDEAFTLARAIYAGRLRPPALDEVRARVLAGDPVPPNARRELRDLGELRAGVTGDDAASRRLLSAIAEQLGVAALVVVTVDAGSPSPAEPEPDVAGDAGAAGDAGEEAGLPPAPPAPPVPAPPVVTARLFLADLGDFDAARYEPDREAEPAAAWRAAVASLERRFPAPAPSAAVRPVAPLRPAANAKEGGESKPFYSSPWFWGALGAAALVGSAFYFASRDTSGDPIHLQMNVPR
jgi:hypothetical protein